MANIQYYVIDTETTGLSNFHEITEISIIRCSDLHQLTKYIKVEHPEKASSQALIKTGRTYEDLLRGESKEKVVEYCDRFFAADKLTIEHRCCIAHNSSFDARFCHALWSSVGKIFPCNLWLDTKPFAKKWATMLGIEKPSLTLESCLQFTGLTPIDQVQHEAAADARNTYLLYKKGCDAGVDHTDFIKRVPHKIDE
jgi:DNA polymerase III epsilon subunit-like protein